MKSKIFKIAISKKSFPPVDTSMFCSKISNVHRFPLFPIVSVFPPDLLKDNDGHVTHTVARQVKMFPCCLVKMFVVDIATVLTKPLMKGFVGLPNVLLKALFALNQVNNVSCVAVVVLMQLHFVIP